MATTSHAANLGLIRIVSGGQTGVDRAALDAAIECGVPHGGWCPRGRIAEDGRIPEHYKLDETDSENYSIRTMKNVDHSDGTLVLYRHRLQGGTALTCRFAKELNKPLLRLNLEHRTHAHEIQRWIIDHHIRILNVAGPRASSDANIHRQVFELLCQVLLTPILAFEDSVEARSHS